MDIKKAIEVLTFHSEMFKKYKTSLVRQSPEDRDLENAIDTILSLTRWRKVEDELPKFNKKVLIRTRLDYLCVASLCNDEGELYFDANCGEEFLLSEIREWQPINP